METTSNLSLRHLLITTKKPIIHSPDTRMADELVPGAVEAFLDQEDSQ